VSIRRRELLSAAAALALTGASIAASAFAVVGAARAQAVSVAELMNPGPLPDMALGSPEARVTVIEYASLTCVHCAQFAATTFPELKRRYIDNGRMRYVFREFPIDDLAVVASMVARCAGDDKYFAAVDLLLRQQEQWVANRVEPLMTLAVKELGFSEQSFNACVTNQQRHDDFKRARARAREVFGVSSVPTFFINGRKQLGSQSIKDMEIWIERLLKS
jgi:protein-disulfide isomerase